MADTATASVEDGKKNFVQKPEKPDQVEFEKNLKIAQDEHAAVRDKINAVKSRLDLVKTPGKSPRQQELYELLNELRSAQQAKKGSRAQIEDQMRELDTSIKAKIKEQNAARGKIPYKTVEELDDAVKQLEAGVESGKLKLVDERKSLAEISSLNKVRKNIASLGEVQKSIDAEKARFDELKQQKRDLKVQELSDKYEAVKQELDDIKAEQDAAFKDLNGLRDERTRLQEEQQTKWQAIQRLRDDYFSAKDAFRVYEQEAWKIKREKRAKQDKEQKQAYRREIAQKKMEEASEKAYTSEILTCEGLIGFFDPSSAEAARKAKLVAEAEPRALAAQPTRAVDTEPAGIKLVKVEEVYFVGTTKKKGKKGRKESALSASESAASEGTSSGGGKFNLNVGILEELAKVDVDTPMGKDDVPKTLEKLREKLAWYKEHQEIRTKENIAKAQKEIERLDAEAAKEDGFGTFMPIKEAEPEPAAVGKSATAEQPAAEEKPAEEPAEEKPAAVQEPKEEVE